MALTDYLFTVTSHASSVNTKGSYTQIVASTPYASSRLVLLVTSGANSIRSFLIDLATGGAGAESVIVADVAVSVDTDALYGAVVALDVDIPAGTRLAVRCQATTANSSCFCTVLLNDRALGSLVAPVTYGANTAASRGTQVDPGGTASTKGSYVQFTASTASRLDALILCVTSVSTGQAITAATNWAIDVATGAGGAESVIVPNVPVVANTSADTVRPPIVRVPVSIPAGTRIAVRCSCNRNTATERVLCVTLIGLQEPASYSGGSAGAVAYVG